MKKLKLLLLDANVIIRLFEAGLWDQFITVCDVHIASTVVGESHFWDEGIDGPRHNIDLGVYKADGSITTFSVKTSEVDQFKEQFGRDYIDRLHAGEAESLTYLCQSQDDYTICSSDPVVFRTLGCLQRGNQGLSLEEVLQQIGLGRKLPRQFTKSYRDQLTSKGFQEGLQGIGFLK